MDSLAEYLPIDDERFFELANEAEELVAKETKKKANTPETAYFNPPLWEQRSSFITSTLQSRHITTVSTAFFFEFILKSHFF